MDNDEAARNNFQDDAVAFLQIRSTNFTQFRSGLVFRISVRIVQDAKLFLFSYRNRPGIPSLIGCRILGGL